MKFEKNTLNILFQPKIWSYSGFVVVLILCFCFFQQVDLFHTMISANGYLEGHFKDFYDYNKTIVSTNDYFPLLYITFFLWNLPLKIMGHIPSIAGMHVSMNDLSSSSTIDIIFSNFLLEIIWSKFLLVLLFFGVSFIVYKIGLFLTKKNSNRSKTIAFIFATSPFAIFAVFIFGQYDIIGLLFTMIGYYYFLQKKLLKFSLFFSIAISYKFFPGIIFLPLLLLAEKRIINIIKYGCIASSLTLLQIALSWHNEAFRSYTLWGIESIKLGSHGGAHTGKFIILFGLICIYAYFKNSSQNEDGFYKNSIFLPIAALASLFANILWHPQWFIYTAPFFALSSLYIKNKRNFFIVEIVGTVAYFFVIGYSFPENVDAKMLENGLLRHLFFMKPLLMASLLPQDRFHIMYHLVQLYLFSPVLLTLYEKLKHSKNLNQELTRTFYFTSWLHARFIVGLGVFLIPTFFCGIAPLYLSGKFIGYIDKSYVLNLLDFSEIASINHTPVGEILPNYKIEQSFRAKEDDLSVISIFMATYARKNTSHVVFTLYDENHKMINITTVDSKELKDNVYFNWKIPVIQNSKNNFYTFTITSQDSSVGNAVTAWMTQEHTYTEGTLLANKKELPGDLVVRLFYGLKKEYLFEGNIKSNTLIDHNTLSCLKKKNRIEQLINSYLMNSA